jgi:uncharacterized protein YyaL (SSP411 family)
VIEQLRQYASAPSGSGEAGQEALDKAFGAFRRLFDPKYGGFGGGQKFPRPAVHNFLVRYYAATGRREALDMVLLTLGEMAKGGMNDQLGGGFHRYSVDERWFVPHFEKMLYDQAQIAISYVEAYQITRNEPLAAVARDVFAYVQRDLTHPDGGFYSAEDADSATDPAHPRDKHEGAFYVWAWKELAHLLEPADLAIFAYRFGVGEGGNVEEDPHGEFQGRNILYQAHTLEETAAKFDKSPAAAESALRDAAAVLHEARAARPRPQRDDKILTGWNGLMISAFAKGAQILGEPRYADAGHAAAQFVRRNLWDEERNVLLRRYCDGESAVEGFLDDYAFFIHALLDLYETGFDGEDFRFAVRLAERARELFEDPQEGGFFSTSGTSPELVLRLKDDYDGAEPSGNSAMALALLRLARMTGREDFRGAAERTLKAFSSRLNSGGAGLPQMLVALQFAMGRPREIVLAGDAAGMLPAIRRHFMPDAVVMMASEAAVPMPAVDGKGTAYVCENYACKLPVTDAERLETQLLYEPVQ